MCKKEFECISFELYLFKLQLVDQSFHFSRWVCLQGPGTKESHLGND